MNFIKNYIYKLINKYIKEIKYSIKISFLINGCYLILSVFIFTSCRTKTVYVPVESVKVIYQDRLQRDSIHLYDSIHIRERGDTVFLEKYKYLYRDKLVRDTVFRRDSVAVPYPVVETVDRKVYPVWLVVLGCMGGVLIGCIVARLLVYFRKK